MKITKFLGMAVLAAATLFTSCKEKEDPTPSFEERKAEFQKAVQNDPQTSQNLQALNVQIYKQVAETKGDAISNMIIADFKKVAAHNAATMSDEEVSKCLFYALVEYAPATAAVILQGRPVVKLEDLSAESQAMFADDSKMAEHMKEVTKDLTYKALENIRESEEFATVAKAFADQFVKAAKKYDITFTDEEAMQLCKEYFTAYSDSLKAAL